jgi:hypothetical protein
MKRWVNFESCRHDVCPLSLDSEGIARCAGYDEAIKAFFIALSQRQ